MVGVGCSLLVLFTVPQLVFSFKIKSKSQNSQRLLEGETLQLKCTTDTDWEFCTWRHLPQDGSDVTATRDCHMEWKLRKRGVVKQDCHPDFMDRSRHLGNYEKNECGIEISGLRLEDAGTWECEVESYVLLGSKGSGEQVRSSFSVEVMPPSTSTLGSSSTATSTTSEATSTSQAVQADQDQEDVHGNFPDSVLVNDEAVSTSTTTESTTTESTTTFKDVDTETETHADLPSYDFVDGHLDRAQALFEETVNRGEEMEEGEGMESSGSGAVVGSVLAVLMLTVLSIAGVFLWRRRRISMDVVSMQKLREEGAAADSLMEEASAAIDIVKIAGQPAFNSPDF